MNRRLLSILLGLGLGVLITLMLLRGPNGQMPGLSLDEAEEYTPWPAPDPSFLSLAGDTLRVSQFRGTHVALFFGYTWCPDVCPITLAQLGKAATELDPDGDKLRLLFVSLDPYRDTPERLATWTQAFHADVVSLTGDLELLRAAAWDWGIDFRYRTLPTPGEVRCGLPGGPHGAHVSDRSGGTRHRAGCSRNRRCDAPAAAGADTLMQLTCGREKPRNLTSHETP
jgi:cytochrome oxidase Cu insertion factor (SCO1/SenC/PrrC family)